jgi:ferric-dicitrate binding protein FerR (iron transport regulator)
MATPVNRSLVIKYFDGLCTSEEMRLVEEWLKQEGNDEQMQQWLWEDWQTTSGKIPVDASLRLKTKLQEQIGYESEHSVLSMKRRRTYSMAAAAILVIMVAGFLLLRHAGLHEIAGQHEVAYRDSIFNKGDRPYKATLADGSTVWLNTGAVLYIADNFGKTERRVKVNGEAFFEIKQDAAHPFYTEAGNITTQVLGTTYDVEAYPTEKDVRVSLLQGKVAVHSADTVCELTPGQMLLYDRQSGSMLVGAVAASDPSAWIKGKIVLNKIALPEALDRLSRLYHVSIQYNYGLIKDKHITGEFDRDALPVVLQSILFVHHLKFSVTGNGGYRIY